MLFAGGMAGIFNWAVAIPPDVLKSRFQTGFFFFVIPQFVEAEISEIFESERLIKSEKDASS